MTKDWNTAQPRTRWLRVFAFFTALGLLLFLYKYLDDLTRARSGTLLRRLIEEMTAAYAVALLFPLVVICARRFRLERRNWLQRLPAHLLALVSFSFAHTTLNALSRSFFFTVSGLGSYDYGILPIRYVMELASDVIVYCLLVSFINLLDHYRTSRERELRTAQLETRLAQAQLQALRLQIQPHFLFNALNTISSIIYEDAQAADRMIARLSDLLRLTLRNSSAQEVTLREELEILHLYLEIMRARFEERLVVNFDVEPETKAALVPQLILQPLIENSIRHTTEARPGAVKIDVFARRENGSLLLEVCDNGPGLEQDGLATPGEGIGLSNTAERLNQLYGAAHRFTLENTGAGGGGLTVRVQLPFHTAFEKSDANGGQAHV